MTPENFCYWLRGYIELSGPGTNLSPEQIKIINDHLSLVMQKVTPVTFDWTDAKVFDSVEDALKVDTRIRCALTC